MQTTTIALALLILVVGSARAENWPQWRGPDFNGVAQGTNYPVNWSATENIAWKTALPGTGTSTPVVWEDRIFVTCQDEGHNALISLNRSGEKLWQTLFGDERAGRNRKASGSNPSPATDGEHVFVYYKSGDLACVDFDGKTIWSKNLQEDYLEDTLWWDLGTSPVLTRDFVVVACMQNGGSSYVVAFDKLTGEVAWKQDRTLPAPVESGDSYTTPVLLRDGDKEILVVLGADHVTAHDAATGQELWRVRDLNPSQNRNFRSIASPVVSDGLVIAPYARGRTLTAIRLGGSGDVTDSHVAWIKDEISADVPTPAAIDGRIYVCGDRGDVACLDIETGEKIWSDRTERARKPFSSSPILADGKLYVTREDGTTFVLAAGDEFELLAENTLGEATVATPVFVDEQILLRTGEHLYCIGEK